LAGKCAQTLAEKCGASVILFNIDELNFVVTFECKRFHDQFFFVVPAEFSCDVIQYFLLYFFEFHGNEIDVVDTLKFFHLSQYLNKILVDVEAILAGFFLVPSYVRYGVKPMP
jgi:hypothetical protein